MTFFEAFKIAKPEDIIERTWIDHFVGPQFQKILILNSAYLQLGKNSIYLDDWYLNDWYIRKAGSNL